MSKTTQDNSNVENSATESVSNTSKARTRTTKTANTTSVAATAASTTKKPARATTTASRSKSAASTTKKATPSSTKTQTSGQQDKTMSQNTVRRVAIIGGNRIPFARSNGPYFRASNMDMLTAALNGLVERFNLQGQRLGEVVAGAVLKHSRDFNMTRECVLNTQLAPETPAYDIQQACGTGLQAAFLVANKIALGQIEVGVAGGVDTTSDAPIAFGDGLRKALLELNIAKTGKDRLKALAKINVKDLMDAPKNGEPRTGLSMGDHQAITALEWGIPREAQDELAAASHQKMAKAYEEGFFDDLITPFMGLDKDNNLRPDSSVEKLAKLKPVFGKGDTATMTAGNSTPLTDGASVVLLASEEWAKANGHEVLAYLTFSETAAVDFVGKKEGLLMAPAYAVPRMLDRAGIKLQDFDYYEIHEAFASQVLSTLKAWEDPKFCKERLGLDAPLGSIDRSKLNVKGSSLAAGHPFAATGGRILATAAKLINQKGSGRVLISICAAGGQGVTAIVEK
ncbi:MULTISPECIES: acetyl-CoA C-acetyltransferase [Acinetobacter]|uniref:acetyl-CoA C-acetyltransferase n=1 Tax=Acinetobacter TaxID=469 RepID=UPI0002AEAC89|nr:MULTISPECIES: acetyl-CoA C-acetyltransferase [Acinetobacter]ELW84088.1 acetyl-CoA C-acetyltransferase [Acinetobacter sp. WC-743]MBJ8428304.1 acetyl-CoA C-acetyltransferase [Acinetobacter bereziniae]MBJ8477399.1 acetyl-CoA C-acetyltransferase [Acinetobacter bereziniae]MBJ8553616.1 acetyl-CoA C-acetyltransferase [Acinetobacter bereziniae]